MKRIVIGLVIILALLAGLWMVFQKQIALTLMARAVERNLTADAIGALPDGLHLGLCGAGSPMADTERSGPCVAVIAGDTLFLVDTGSGAARILGQMGFNPGLVSQVLLTHFHSDHIDGLGEVMTLRWANGGHDTPLPLIGPSGVEDVAAGFNMAYAADMIYRRDHHGADIVPPSGHGVVARPFSVPEEGDGVIVYKTDDLTVTAFSVDHAPVEPSVGYRFDYKDRSLVISGDTKKSANLEQFAKGTDLLVHEALSPKLVGVMTNAAEKAGRQNLATITVDILDYHTTPVEAAESAQTAGAKHLLFYHIVPPLPLKGLEKVFVEGVSEAYDGPFTVGVDGVFFSLPAGSDRIKESSRL